jgi:GNAT superfamily N-acetyltransferase
MEIWPSRSGEPNRQTGRHIGHPAASLGIDDGDTLVLGMYVAPQARGHHYAHHLLDAIVDVAVRRRDKRLVLEVTSRTCVPVAATAAMGFVETGRPRTMERDPAITEIEPGCPLAAEAPTDLTPCPGAL